MLEDKTKGFTLIETLFAFFILTAALIYLTSILSLCVSTSNKLDCYERLQEYEERLANQFYPVDSLEMTLEEILET